MLTVFFQMLALILMIGTGYVITRKGMMDEHTNGQISGMVVNVFIPLLFFSGALNAGSFVSMDSMVLVFLIAMGMYVFFLLSGMLLTPFFEKRPEQMRIFQMMCVFSNTGFIGVPVVNSVLGPEYLIFVTEFLLAYNLFFYTYGIMMMDGSFSVSSLKAMVNPGMVCSVAAVAIVLGDIHLPDFIETAITCLGNTASPLALILVGFSLACADLGKILREGRLYLFSLLKLLVLPLLMLPVLRMVTDDRAVTVVCMAMFGMPVGSMILMLGNERGMDGTTCGAAIILSTVLCVFTIPVLLAVI